MKALNPLNKAQNPPKTLAKTLPKRLQNSILSSNARNPQKMRPSYTKTSFLTVPGLQKSSQNRCQNVFKISFVLDTLLESPKIRFLKLKRRQDGRPKFPFIFFKKRPEILPITVFGPRCLLEASKSLPRASRDPPKSRSRALKKLHAASQEPSQRLPRASKSLQEEPDTQGIHRQQQGFAHQYC